MKKHKSELFRLRFVLFAAVRWAEFPLFPFRPARSDPVLGQYGILIFFKTLQYLLWSPQAHPTAVRRPSAAACLKQILILTASYGRSCHRVVMGTAKTGRAGRPSTFTRVSRFVTSAEYGDKPTPKRVWRDNVSVEEKRFSELTHRGAIAPSNITISFR